MGDLDITDRDREYLRAVYLLNGENEPVGPTKLAKNIGVSRVGALKKMRRLEAYDLGVYIHRKGIKLNGRAVKIVERDILIHHVLENYFQQTLGIGFEEACDESSAMGPEVSDRLIDSIIENYGKEIECECGLCLEPPYDPEELKECHWCSELITRRERGDVDDR